MSTALQSEDLAFESLYRLHRPPVYAYALSKLRQPADAEDATQTTFLNAYCALHRGVAPRDDLQWLLAIARNVCRDRYRDAERRPKEEPLADWMRLVQPEKPDYSVSEIVKEISELNPRYRQILLMREFEGRSYSEISAELGVSEPAIQSLLVRARRALRDELELGMTCVHARRVALRHLNGVALRDERRALQRHLRKCAECATFVGRTPRTPVARMLWLIWLPYRRIMTIIAGTSAPAGSTAGSSTIAAKLLTIAVVGGAAAGVTAREVADAPTVGHVKRPPGGPIGLPHQRQSAKAPVSTAVTTAWGSQKLTTGREAVTPTSHRDTRWLPRLSSRSIEPPLAVPPPVSAHTPSSTLTSSNPTAPEAGEAEAAQATPSGEPSAVTSSGSTPADAPPVSSVSGVPSANTLETASAETTDSSASTAAPTSSTNLPDATAPVTPATTPPATPQTPPGQGPQRGNGDPPGYGNNGNAVGQDGTPPGQLNKPDPPAHGRG